MKKSFLFMTTLLLTIFSVGCSSDDSTAPIIEPPTTIDFKKEIQKSWELTAYQLLDKDRKTIEEFSAKRSDECKNNVWEFKEVINSDNEKEDIRMDYVYYTDDDTNECVEYRKTVFYSVEDKELVTAIVNDGDQLMLTFFEIQEMSKEKMVLFVKDTEYTEEEAISNNWPKETRFIQYVLKPIK